HNPNSKKTIKLFHDYAGVDLTKSWHWNNYELKTVSKTLDRNMKLRGDVVHRSRPISQGRTTAHPVKKEDLEKVISFLKSLVEATERAFVNSKNRSA
ncbi:MAG: hypothetical protein JRC77_11315, partial [Deltaproteobacteria bacterium]|nr:hypothetical protein [Deltaproteobacteria bacterium]